MDAPSLLLFLAALATAQVDNVNAKPQKTESKLLDCIDKRDGCAMYAAHDGYCQYWNNFMLRHCQDTCGFCDPKYDKDRRPSVTNKPVVTTSTPEVVSDPRTTEPLTDGKPIGGPIIDGGAGCKNRDADCVVYAKLDGYCQYQKDYMMKHCPLACNFCDEVAIGGVGGPTPDTNDRDKISGIGGPSTGDGSKPNGAQTEAPNTDKDHKMTTQGPTETPQIGRCLDTRENCTYWAKIKGYCRYESEYMRIYCPFSCGFCGTSLTGPYPHPPVIEDEVDDEEAFPPIPDEKYLRWIPVDCGECHHGYHECRSSCVFLYDGNVYEPTSTAICQRLLGDPLRFLHC